MKFSRQNCKLLKFQAKETWSFSDKNVRNFDIKKHSSFQISAKGRKFVTKSESIETSKLKNVQSWNFSQRKSSQSKLEALKQLT